MSDDNLDHGLAAIADHGHRTGRLEAGECAAGRGDRRRRRRYAATGAFGVVLAGALGVGIAVARPHAETPSPPVASASDPVLPVGAAVGRTLLGAVDLRVRLEVAVASAVLAVPLGAQWWRAVR